MLFPKCFFPNPNIWPQNQSGKLRALSLQVLQDHSDEVWHLQFSHNGRFLATGSKDSTAIIYTAIMGTSQVSHGVRSRHPTVGSACVVDADRF